MRKLLSYKKGDTGSGAAALVLLIALVIIFYVLAVDPEVRQEILSDTDTPGSPGTSPSLSSNALLDKQPGKVQPLGSNILTRGLSAIRIEAKKRSIEPLKGRSVFASNGLFTEEADSLLFSLDSPRSSYVDLTFNAKKREGRLVVTLNDNIIFNQKMKGPTPNPISLPKEYLKENNVLEFRVSGPGITFWKVNNYVLEDVKVAGNYIDESDLEGSRNFIVLGAEELLNTEKLTLEYTLTCLAQSASGSLSVKINDQVISKTVPLCDDIVREEFLPEKLVTGDNKLSFSADSGRYLIEPVRIKFHFKKSALQEYLFELKEDSYKKIKDTDKTAELNLEFSTDAHKSLTVRVNGNSINIDETGRTFSQNIEGYLREGKNYVTLEPRSSDVTLLSLKVLTK
jgi:hypothetical protein